MYVGGRWSSATESSSSIDVGYMANAALTCVISLCSVSSTSLTSSFRPRIPPDIIPEKVEMINQRKSPIQDEYIEKYLKIVVKRFGFPQKLRTKNNVVTVIFLTDRRRKTYGYRGLDYLDRIRT